MDSVFEAINSQDSGTGASAIYPLLACRQHPSWLFLGTEVDAKSEACATENVKKNSLDSRIKVVGIDSNSVVLIPSNELASLKQYGLLYQHAIGDITDCDTQHRYPHDQSTFLRVRG